MVTSRTEDTCVDAEKMAEFLVLFHLCEVNLMGVAFAPTSVEGRGECDPRVGANVTPAFVWQAQ